ncbi:MAG: imidazolonepropionase [Legionella sp.]|nr:MAG: imidazolonepropionase [Legionella sp.]
MFSCDKLFINASTIAANGQQLADQAVVIQGAKIAWSGAQNDLPDAWKNNPQEQIDCQGQVLTAGLVDCHTHLVYAGDRAAEFKLKLDGVSYTEIAQAGGGILSTVKQTRAASEMQLLEESLPRILALRAGGVTTVEIKSGYGLDLATEMKMLKVARRLGELSGLRVKTTFLGAHTVPPEFKGRNQDYVDFLCKEMLPAIQQEGLADAVDVFCESIGFSVQQTEQIYRCAKNLNLPVKCHAEQLSNLGASVLAAQYNALSCDHLEFLDEDGAKALAKANTVAVILPGAYYFLREQRKPPIDLLRKAGVGMAIATDCNPGSSPTTSLLLMMSMACTFFSFSVQEALAAVTYQAAKALGLAEEIGEIAVGKAADLILWSVKDSAALCYYVGSPIAHRSMIAGQWISNTELF